MINLTNFNIVLSVGVDKLIKVWNGDEFSSDSELVTIVGPSPFTSCDFALDDSEKFLTSSSVVELWDVSRSDAIRKWEWGHDTYNKVKFNPVECDLAAATVSDKSVVLYDVRASEPMKKITLAMQSNGIAWNPQQAMIFTVANEDNNLYSFDLRNVRAMEYHLQIIVDAHNNVHPQLFARNLRLFSI